MFSLKGQDIRIIYNLTLLLWYFINIPVSTDLDVARYVWLTHNTIYLVGP